jgi:hypothetical protein
MESLKWLNGESSSWMAAAMPPWANSVLPADTSALVTTSTRRRLARRMAALSPAMPEPRTRTSVVMVSMAVMPL